MGGAPTYYLVLALAGASVLLLVQTVMGTRTFASRRVAFANLRMKMLDKGMVDGNRDTADALARMRRRRGITTAGAPERMLQSLRDMVTQSGLPIRLWVILMAGPVLGTVLGTAVYLWREVWPLAAVAAAAGLVVPVLFLRWAVKRRRDKAVAQLPDALDVIIRSLAAGHPVPVAMGLVAREMADPIGSEFGMASDEIGYGASVAGAVQRMSERIGHEDVALFAAMIRLQERTGGNLAELLRANAKTIRDRQTMRLKVKAASAEGRMSALILNLAPVGMLIAVQLMSPEFYGDVAGHPAITYGFGFAFVWMIIGNLFIRKLINFRI